MSSLEKEPAGLARAGGDWVIREEPLIIDVAGETVLTMRTPGADEDLALGFLLGEGVISSTPEVRELKWVPATAERPEGACDVVTVVLADPARAQGVSGKLARAHELRASCGLCGRASAEGLTAGLAPLEPAKPRVALEALAGMVRALEAGQELFKKTGGSHGAALFSATGELWSLAEDVGRHNALDKAIGRAAREGRDLRQAVALLSGRGGFELVLKCLRVGIAVVASVSAASSLAVEIVEEAGGTLVGFVRDAHAPRIYADEGRLSP